MAVQWHPEEMVSNSPEQREIFVRFVEKCREGGAKVIAAKITYIALRWPPA